MSQWRSKVIGWGSYLPKRVVKNDDLAGLMETNDEWIRTRTGIKERRWAEPSQATSDLALEASKEALERAKLDKSEIDMIIFATLSPDHEFPGTGCFLQAKLGVAGIPALDLRQQCTGFVYAMSVADQYIRTGTCKNILVVGAELHSKGLDKTTRGRDVAVLFGDGAGAFIVARTEVKDPDKDSHFISAHLHADGSFAKELWLQAGGMAYPKERIDHDALERAEQYPQMNGKAVFVHASKRMPEAIMEALNANNFKIDDVDLFIFHQANQRINDIVGKQLKIDPNKVFNTIDRYANTTAATLPIGYTEAVTAGKLKPGMLVASAAFGSGFTWGSFLLRW